MNQDQVKQKLLELEPDCEEFFLIFSGKQSKKAHGIYYPQRREIIIHNRNFDNDNQLMYTAIHEFAHHVHCSKSTAPLSNRAHTIEFRSIFHQLLAKAEAMGLYQNSIEAVKDLRDLATSIRQRFMKANGELMKEFGQALMEAEKLCRKHGSRFEDFVERALCLPKQTAATVMKFTAMDLPAAIGYENMKTLAGLRNPQARAEAAQAFLSGASPDVIKQNIKAGRPTKPADPRQTLILEQRRIEKTLAALQKRLDQIYQELNILPSLPVGSEGVIA